ncbi:hypothetical protein [Herbaspirillum rubrisubalbicans]|uniref:hypothetical protein n=1 Tax=Herbaspirillum rubrisubalbicans TaxID=80842 RepID=UPI0015C57401|nr:hypothetical protein [Herbaspirillum rubrisubalbicans]
MMNKPSFKLQVLLFLYSTRNLAGCVLALIGLGCFFAGFINDWWYAIVVAMYVAGWLAAPQDRELNLQILQQEHENQMRETIDQLLTQAGSRLPKEAIQKLKKMGETIEDLVPKIQAGQVTMQHSIVLINAVTRDLPQTVRNYLQLPPAFAAVHTVEGGKTCKQLLLDQLDILGNQLVKLTELINKDDAEALIKNGKFLQEKFQPVSFL